jgi:hypothetical protein
MWRFEWRRELFVWEEELVNELLVRLDGRVLGVRPDVWLWKPDREGGFSVKSCYTLLQDLFHVEAPLFDVEKVFFGKFGDQRHRLRSWRSRGLCCLIEFQLKLILLSEAFWGRTYPKGVSFVIEEMNRRHIFLSIVNGYRRCGGR